MPFRGSALLWRLLFLVVTVALVGAGVWRLHGVLTAENGRKAPPLRERVYAVDSAMLAPQTVAPTLSAFGTIESWRNLEIRAAVAGPIASLADAFKNGAAVADNALLFTIDTADLETRVAEAEIALAEAKANLAEARATLDLKRQEVKTAERQVTLRRSDLARKQQVKQRGHASQATVEEASLALVAAEQSLLAQRQAVLTTEAKMENGALAVKRADLALAQAERDLADAAFRAPFAGRLDAVKATLGRRVSENEALGRLIDPTALEVAFRLREADFVRLLAPDGINLRKLPVRVSFDLADRHHDIHGTLDRAAAVVDSAVGGRMVYARLDPKEAALLHPGDFVTVTVEEPALPRIALVPPEAVSEDGRLFLVGADNRLEEMTVRIARRLPQGFVLAEAPFGRIYVTRRLPQLAAGIKVTLAQDGPPPPDNENAGKAPQTKDQTKKENNSGKEPKPTKTQSQGEGT